MAVTRRRDPFTTALESLRDRVEQGVYPPGSPVVIIDEARRLRLSTTPVREALGWLCGYGLIERAPLGGFVTPRLDPALVRDRLAVRLHCLTIGLNGLAEAHRPLRREGVDEPDGQGLAARMLRIVRATGNAALVDAYRRVDSQLIQLAGAERRVFRDVEAETGRLLDLFAAPAGSGLGEALGAYHHRRMEAAPLLIMEAEAHRALSPPES